MMDAALLQALIAPVLPCFPPPLHTMKKTLNLLLLVMAGAAAAGFWWWQHGQEDANSTLIFQGNVDIRQVSLVFEGSGRVHEIRVQEGDGVRAGDVLATLDTRTLGLQADQARAQVEVQTQNLQRLQTGNRPEEIAQARSRLHAAQADAARARDELARLQRVYSQTGGRGVSAQAIDTARSGLRVAQARVAELRDALKLSQQGARTEDIAAARAQLKAAQAQQALLQHQIDEGELRAPSHGVVRSRLLEPGEMASAQRTVLTLALTQPKWVRIYVPEPDLSRIRSGMAAEVRTDGQSAHRLAGQIGYISAVAEFTPKTVQTPELRTTLVYEVRVQVQDEHDRLRLGQPVTVQLADDGQP